MLSLILIDQEKHTLHLKVSEHMFCFIEFSSQLGNYSFKQLMCVVLNSRYELMDQLMIMYIGSHFSLFISYWCQSYLLQLFLYTVHDSIPIHCSCVVSFSCRLIVGFDVQKKLQGPLSNNYLHGFRLKEWVLVF